MTKRELNQLIEGYLKEAKVYKGISGDPYEYAYINNAWHARKQGSQGWKSLAGNSKATTKLNRLYPNASKSKSSSEPSSLTPPKSYKDVYSFLVVAQKIKEGEKVLVVDGYGQRYYLYAGTGNVIKQGRVSTGAKGFGNEAGAGTTATGLMQISAIAGRGEPKYTVLVGKRPTSPRIILGANKTSPRKGHSAEVLTRALVLTGLQPENRNVARRNIYMHGTNVERRLGRRASGGCIRAGNDDIMELADSLLAVGDKFYVHAPGAPSLTQSAFDTVSRYADIGIESAKELFRDTSTFAQDMSDTASSSFQKAKEYSTDAYSSAKDAYSSAKNWLGLSENSNSLKEFYEEESTIDGKPSSDEELDQELSKYPPELTA